MNLRKQPERPAPPEVVPQPHRPSRHGAAAQDEQRDRRRKRLPVHLTETFDLAAEVATITSALACEVSRLKRPVAARREVDALADAVGEVVHVAAGLVAESRTADGQTRQNAADLAVRPRQPAIGDDALVSGLWADQLKKYADTVRAELSAVLGRALPPAADGLRGAPSASERLERSLRGVDAAALALGRCIPRIRERQELPPVTAFNRQQQERIQNERAARRLAQIGVS